MKDEKLKEEKKDVMREIIIKTDGNKIQVVKAEVAGNLEFKEILRQILANLS